jgi:hypothetical protein
MSSMEFSRPPKLTREEMYSLAEDIDGVSGRPAGRS